MPIILEQPEVNEVWLTLPHLQSNVGDNIGFGNVTDTDENVTDTDENVTNADGNVTNTDENVTKTDIRRGYILENMI